MIVRWQAGSRGPEGCDRTFQLGAARGWAGSDPIGSPGIVRDAEGFIPIVRTLCLTRRVWLIILESC